MALSSVNSQAEGTLREQIVSGALKPGQRLVERVLCEDLGVSRATVREVLRKLEADGLVSATLNKGAVVSEVSVRDAEELYEVREAFEALAARLIVQRAGKRDIDALETALEHFAETCETGTLSSMLSAKDRFYSCFYAAAGNNVLSQAANQLYARVRQMRTISLGSEGRWQESVAEIKRLLAAIRHHDVDAAEKNAILHVQSARAAALVTLRRQATADQK